MAGFKKGDTVYFTGTSFLVNEGTVEEVQGVYLKVKTKCPGVTHVAVSQAFPTREELRESKAYHAAWFAKQQRERARASFTRMASLW